MKTCECKVPSVCHSGICSVCFLPWEQEEDRLLHIESEAYGKANAQEFATEHSKELMELICIYPDSEAHNRLDNLRELFWARVWKSKVNHE